MALKTKSIQAPTQPSDGIRVCIMRKPGSHNNYDLWMPALAPSLSLLAAYNAHEIAWEEYEIRFERERELCMKSALSILCDLSKCHDITILCWEESPEFCHRRLIARACAEYFPELKKTMIIR